MFDERATGASQSAPDRLGWDVDCSTGSSGTAVRESAGIGAQRARPDWGAPSQHASTLRLHRSHQSNLLRKEPAYYRQFGWNVPEDLPYFWPVA